LTRAGIDLSFGDAFGDDQLQGQKGEKEALPAHSLATKL
jgi:hypothetical protein